MIAARKVGWFNAWFAGHARGRLQASFAAVRIAGLATLRQASAEGPLVIISNHTSWWDPLVALYLANGVVGGDWYALMDAKNLRRLPFFALVGAFGVDLDSVSDGAASMRYSARLLKGAKSAVWIFPQGAERPHTLRPLGFRAGSAEIARIAKSATLPIALRYEFRHGERAELLIDIGAPIAPVRDVAEGRARHETAVTEGLDRIEADLRAEDFARYETVLAAPESAVGAFFERLLARMTSRYVLEEGSRRGSARGP